jgi:hypothetical protein
MQSIQAGRTRIQVIGIDQHPSLVCPLNNCWELDGMGLLFICDALKTQAKRYRSFNVYLLLPGCFFLPSPYKTVQKNGVVCNKGKYMFVR